MNKLFFEIRKAVGWLFLRWGYYIIPDDDEKFILSESLYQAILRNPLLKKYNKKAK